MARRLCRTAQHPQDKENYCYDPCRHHPHSGDCHRIRSCRLPYLPEKEIRRRDLQLRLRRLFFSGRMRIVQKTGCRSLVPVLFCSMDPAWRNVQKTGFRLWKPVRFLPIDPAWRDHPKNRVPAMETGTLFLIDPEVTS